VGRIVVIRADREPYDVDPGSADPHEHRLARGLATGTAFRLRRGTAVARHHDHRHRHHWKSHLERSLTPSTDT
jgi:hypothetical protein